MLTGQILIYHYNNYQNSKDGVNRPRNQYEIKSVSVKTKERFQEAIEEALDTIHTGNGYILVKYGNRFFQCERDANKPKNPYAKFEIKYHPLLSKFS